MKLSERLAEIRAAAAEAAAARCVWLAARDAWERDFLSVDWRALKAASALYRERRDHLAAIAMRLEIDGTAEFLESLITLEEQLNGLRLPEPRLPAPDRPINGL